MRVLLIASAALIAAPVFAQDHSAHAGRSAQPAQVDHCAMGHLPPEQCPPKEDEEKPAQQQTDHSAHTAPDAKPEEMDHCAMGHLPPEQCPPKAEVAQDHSQMDHGAMNHSAHTMAPDKSVAGAASEDAVPPRAFEGPRHAADAIWGEDAMAPARRQLVRENGAMRFGSVMVERLEARFAADGGEDGYVWDAQAFYGGDVNRFVLKTEGEGELSNGPWGEIEEAEIQALYSRAIGPFFDLQAGVRFDPETDARGHLVLGVQGLAPYMFHVDAAAFLSDKGDLTARLEGEYDQKLTQRLILQPRMEIELAAQDIPEREIGAGISKIEPGVRLRYEIVPEFAPYIGVEYEAKLGETADIARANGEDPDGLKLIAGLRFWF